MPATSVSPPTPSPRSPSSHVEAVTRFRFGAFVVDEDTVEVIGPEGVREVEPQVFGVLRYLVEQRGRLVTKERNSSTTFGVIDSSPSPH